MSYIKTRYTGVYYRLSQDKDKIYYIRYNVNKKQIEEKVGSASQGFTEKFAANLRIERLSVDSPIIKKYLFSTMIDLYLESVKNNTRMYKYDSARFAKYVRSFFEDRHLHDITTADVVAF